VRRIDIAKTMGRIARTASNRGSTAEFVVNSSLRLNFL